MPKLVTLGAGTGQRKLLEGLESTPCEVTAVVGVTDNGGSSATLRRALSIPQPGDARNCLTATARNPVLRALFDFRFREGELEGLSLGNYILAALACIEGDFGLAVERANELLDTRCLVLPSSATPTQVGAELVTGARIVGEWEIIRREPRARILRVFLEEEAPLYPLSRRALEQADLLVIGPGSLLTGIVPVLLTRGLRDAVRASSAPIAYICNLMTQPGQTDGFSARDHVEQVERYLGFSVDHILLNDAPLPSELVAHYRAIGSEPVRDDLEGDLRTTRGRYLQDDSAGVLARHDRPDNVFLLHHDPRSIAAALLDVLPPRC